MSKRYYLLYIKRSVYFFAFIYLFSLTLGTSQESGSTEIKTTSHVRDSVGFYISQSQNKNVSTSFRLSLLLKAYMYAKKQKKDSIRANALSKLSYAFFRNGDSVNFREVNKTAISLGKKIQDSIIVANAYWDLGDFFKRTTTPDSSYYAYSQALKIYEFINDDYNSSLMLLNMAAQQETVKDYVGSEANTVTAIKRLKPLKKFKQLHLCYNQLGIIAKDLGEYDKAIGYYKEALNYSNKLSQNTHYEPRMLNNIGVVYRSKNDYQQAANNFQAVLNTDSIKQKNIELYAKALNNLAICRIKLKDTFGIKTLINESIQLKDSLGLESSLATSYATLAEYYLFNKDTAAAIATANQAKELARGTNNNMRILETLAFLTNVDRKNASVHGQAYITLNDSLQLEERRARNKFARIRFETDQLSAENEVLSVEKEILSEEKELLSKQNQIWAALAAGFFLFGLAIYVIVDQRSKNQKLRFQQQQQFSNQEIFNLMLSQKQKVDEVKRMEQKRISEELHDGVLGKMLGARMVLTGLNKKANEDSIRERSEAIVALKNIENELRTISHELSHTAYQKINNFVNSIESLLASATGATNISTIFNYDEDEDWDSLLGDIKINVYRIIQENIQNAIKHSGCSNFFINFEIKEDLYVVTLGDNGKGFSFDKERKGIGLRNIKSRVSKMNGKLSVNTEIGNGTVTVIEIPAQYSNTVMEMNTN